MKERRWSHKTKEQPGCPAWRPGDSSLHSACQGLCGPGGLQLHCLPEQAEMDASPRSQHRSSHGVLFPCLCFQAWVVTLDLEGRKERQRRQSPLTPLCLSLGGSSLRPQASVLPGVDTPHPTPNTPLAPGCQER